MPSFTQKFTLTSTSGQLVAPPAVSLGAGLGDGKGTEGSISAHWNDVKSGFNRVPVAVNAVAVNSYQDFGETTSWNGDTGNWSSANGLPIDGSVAGMLQYHFTNGTNTDSDYAGFIAGNYDTRIQNSLAGWKSRGLSKIYCRINWEFNTNFRNWGVPNSGQVSNWVGAWKRFANVAHTWGNANAVNVRMVWCPDTSYSGASSSTFNLPVINFFPIPDAQAVNGRYIDVIGADNYMGGWGVKNNFGQGFTTALATNTLWSLGTFVKICQTYNCNFGMCEFGDGPSFDQNNAWSDGTMVNWATYLDTLRTLSPPVAIEFLALFDVNTGGASQQTGGNQPNMMAGWRCAMGVDGTQPKPANPIPQIMTIAPT